MVWWDWVDLAAHRPYILYANKPAGGEWSEISYLPNNAYGAATAVVIGPDGALHIVWEYPDNYENEEIIAYLRRNLGGTWSTVEEVPIQEGWPSGEQPDIGVAPDGSVQVAYQGWLGPGHEKLIYHNVRSSGGEWGTPEQVTLNEGDYTLPLLAVDDEGTAHLVYTKNYTDHYELYYAYKVSGGPWTTPSDMGVSPTPWNSVEQFTNGANGRIHLAWIEWLDNTSGGSFISWAIAFLAIGRQMIWEMSAATH